MSQIIPTSSDRVFPDAPPSSTHTVPLSILDASVGNFGSTAAAWIYDARIEQENAALDPAQLKLSLVCTLNAYPQWAGQLQYTAYIRGGSHTARSRRLEVVYGAPTDPGVEFVVASSGAAISDVFPSLDDRTSGLGAFDASSLGTLSLLPSSPALASHSNGDFKGLPCLIVQVTSFKCGGAVIAIKSSHPLADAQTLTTFVNDWAAVNRALLQNLPPPVLTPSFSPAALDQAALGDIDAPAPDPEILRLAHELPIHRYDWWASADGCSAGALPSTKIPPHLASLTDIELGPPIPWHEWDLQAPARNFLLHFSADELTRIWAAAASPGPGPPISRFDALQAHLWAALIRARVPETPEETFHFNVTLGVRDRVAPPLPPRTLGSPIVLARASGTAETPLPRLARAIRETVGEFTPPRVAALLHEMAFDVDARRMWAAFIGRRNTIVTSWVRLGVYEVDFGAGRPRFVQSVMPAMDGVVQVMEAGPRSGAGGPWYQDGASVSVMLPAEVIKRILEDSEFRKYR
ncbi:transferase family-domain-containing protein [Mycena galopus ATCC 62051]|nr:transferase family-domain-containing protein [Mycena galopus ATCC 62051]